MNRLAPLRSTPGRAPQRGYALILMLVLVSLGILYAVTSQVSVVGEKVARSQVANAAMVRARDALIAYAATYGDTNPGNVFGYLPCPDTATKSGFQFPGDGNAAGTCSGAGITVAGLLPYKALGLDDLRDNAGVCLWYVVSGTFKNHIASTQPMNWDTQGQITVQDANSNTLYSPGDLNGGAAAVIIAAGAPLATQSRTGTTYSCNARPAEIAAYLESSINGTANGITTLTQGSAISTTNNDQILAITPREIFDRVIHRADFKNPLIATPPGLLNSLSDNIRRLIEAQLQTDLTNGASSPTGIAIPDAASGGYAPINGKLIGDLSPLVGQVNITNASWASSIATFTTSAPHWLLPGQWVTIAGVSPANYNDTYRVSSTGLSATTFQVSLSSNPGTYVSGGTAAEPYRSHWRNQYRYAACNDLSNCLNVAATDCRGALMFAGRSTIGPRGPTGSLATLGNYFENAGTTPPDANGGLDLLNSNAMSFPMTGNTSYLAPNPSPPADVATCLFSGTLVSFAQNIADFGASSSAATPIAQVNTGASNVQLGNSGSSGGVASTGCVWDVNALPLNTSIRLYFRANFANKGNGIALALADGATNQAPNAAGRSQIMCGAASSDSLGYAGTPPSGSAAGINSPKLGIELDTNYSSTRNDPHADHSALLFWGAPGDNGTAGSGADDATHYNGAGGVAVTNVSVSVSTATFTTASPHGFRNGQTIIVSGINPSGYNGTYTILPTGLTATQFQANVTNSPGTFVSAGMARLLAGVAVTNASRAGTIATFTTPVPHGFTSGQTVTVSGIAPGGYNGTRTVLASGLTSTQFQVSLSSAPGTFVSPGTVLLSTQLAAGSGPRNPRVATGMRQFSISNARYPSVVGGNQVVITTTATHRIVSTDTVYIYGIGDPRYNGVQTVVACASGTASNRFCYVPGSVPSAGPYTSGTAVQGTEVSRLVWSGGTATATSPGPLPFHSGAAGFAANIFGVTPSAYQRNNIAISRASPNFSYVIGGTTNPGSFLTESPAGMLAFRRPTTSPSSPTPHSYVDASSIPANTALHVRLDISRRYDAVNHVAVLDIKAYLSDTNSLGADGCNATYFQSMTDDLATLCPSRKPTLQQDAIPVNALAHIDSLVSVTPPLSTTTTVTATTNQPHRLVNGARIVLSGVTPAAYNGTHTITVTGPNTFTYTLNNAPGIHVSGGDIQAMSTFYLGFSNARGSTSAAEDQSVTLDQLVLRSQ